MKGIIQFIGRLTLASLLLVVLAIAVYLVTIIGFIASGKLNAGIMGAAYPLSITKILAPAIFVASLTSGDVKSTRSWAAIKSMAVVSAIYTLWYFSIGPWIGNKTFAETADTHLAMIAIDGIVVYVLMFLSGILAANWLPSLKSSATGTPPKPVKNFEILMFIYLGILVINAALNYDHAIKQVTSLSSNIILSEKLGGLIVRTSIVSSVLIILYLTTSVSRSGSKAMRQVMLSFYSIYLIGAVFLGAMFIYSDRIMFTNINIESLLKTNQTSVITNFALLLIEGLALYLVFTPESNKWFAGDDVSSY